MAISANTLGQTASTLMSQLSAGTITFDSYRNSMNSVIQSANNNPEFKDEVNAVAIYTVNIATRLSEGEAPQTRRK
jgi:hypothetical protein